MISSKEYIHEYPEEYTLKGEKDEFSRSRSPSESGGGGDQHQHKRVLGRLFVISLTFFSVSGGPYGSEGVISSAGPLPGILGLLLFPLVWATPVAFMTAELSTTFPDDGGYSIWVTEAFGTFWGIQQSWWSWCSGVVDNAIYPVIVYHSCSSAFDVELSPLWKNIATISLAIVVHVFALPNLLLLKKIGLYMSILSIIVIVPFILFIMIGLPQVDIRNLFINVNANISNYRNLLSILYWSYSGFDAVSTSAGEIKNAKQNVPNGLLFALLIVSFMTILPLAIAAGVNKPAWQDWDEGSFPKIARHVGGQWLGYSIMIASIAGSLGLYIHGSYWACMFFFSFSE
eukprot:GSMAST32.ASY1.ANO1.1243.1 assembled CDS